MLNKDDAQKERHLAFRPWTGLAAALPGGCPWPAKTLGLTPSGSYCLESNWGLLLQLGWSIRLRVAYGVAMGVEGPGTMT